MSYSKKERKMERKKERKKERTLLSALTGMRRALPSSLADPKFLTALKKKDAAFYDLFLH